MSEPDIARRVAFGLISEVIENGKLLSELTLKPNFMALKTAERARAQRLATEALRGLERVDRILSRYLNKKPPLKVMNILRLATFELCVGGEAYGVVNDAVNLVASQKKISSFKGLVNAVLRKVSKSGPDNWFLMRPPRIPSWLRSPLKEFYGNQVIKAIERVQSRIPPTDLTLKDPSHVKSYATLLEAEIVLGQSVRLHKAKQVSKLKGYDIGDWWVQDAAAAVPVRLLGRLNGVTALDLCAAPGGKTLQLAASGAKVTAVDVSSKRLSRLEENLKRTRLFADVQVMDACDFKNKYFDVIVLDAPCSATGTLRRHPDLLFAKKGSDFTGLFNLQKAMLEHAIDLLKPRGRLVYCTCSLLPEEGEVQVEKILSKRSDIEIDSSMFRHSFIKNSWLIHPIGIRLRPDYLGALGGMDGFFISLLHKKA